MKKIIVFVVSLIILISTITGCTTLVTDSDGILDRGAEIRMHLTTQIYNFDPQLPITDAAMLKYFSLIYEGLTTLNSNGKWEKALMSNYTVENNDLDGFSVIIELKSSKWTDGRTVQAVDFVYSWKRLLSPDNKSGESASLLYDIKNARTANLGDCSIDDVGISAVDTYTLKVNFSSADVNLDRFFTNASSIALVPLREDIVTRFGDAYWAGRSGAIMTNGPFAVKAMEEDGICRLERSSYYYRDTEKNEILDKYVIPYKLITDYSKDISSQLAAFDNGEIFYIDDLPLDARAERKNQATVSDLLSTHTYFFNTTNPLFKDAKVRRALSLALDRDAIAEILTFAKPAKGVVPEGAFNTDYRTSFRKEGGALIESTANVSEAKSLLSSAGVNGGSFSILVRDTEADQAVASYVKEVWEGLGFNIRIRTAKNDHIERTETEGIFTYVIDEFEEAYTNGDFDVIAVDLTMYSPDPFQTLAQFATDFSGKGVDLSTDTYPTIENVTGYNNEDYIALIEQAYNTNDIREKAIVLHQAEELLIEEMPVIPLVQLQSAYLKSNILSGFKTTFYGTTDFRRVTMKDYMKYKIVEE